MAEKEPTQVTPKDRATRDKLQLPKRSEGGNEIPVPTRRQVEADFAKIVAPPAADKKRRRGRHAK
jgi:hypothetical protein